MDEWEGQFQPNLSRGVTFAICPRDTREMGVEYLPNAPPLRRGWERVERNMAKGQMRSNKEKKKPKADKNKKQKGVATPSPFASVQPQRPGQSPYGKKG